MRIGVVILPDSPWSTAQSLWRKAEELGFEHAWTYDHLAWRSLRDAAWFGAVPTLAAAAMVTTRIRLGTLVASPNFRHPVAFAKDVITLDDLSAGRLTLGVGAGGEGWDATMLGQAKWLKRERADRFVEFVELLDRLLRDPTVSYEGKYYCANEARNYPGCTQRPRVPFAIAATKPRGMRLAAMYGQLWVTTGNRIDDQRLDADAGAKVVGEQIRQLERACVAIGRDPTSIRRLVVAGPQLDQGLTSVEAFRATIDLYSAAGVTDFVVHWPRRSDPFAGDIAAFEHIIASCLRSALSA